MFFFTYRPIREPQITLPCNQSVRPYRLGAYFLGFLPIIHYNQFPFTVIHFSFHFLSSLYCTSLNNTILISLFYSSIFQLSAIPSVNSFHHTIPSTQLLVPSHPSLTHPPSAPQLVRCAFPFNSRIPASSLLKFKHRSVLEMENFNTNG